MKQIPKVGDKVRILGDYGQEDNRQRRNANGSIGTVGAVLNDCFVVDLRTTHVNPTSIGLMFDEDWEIVKDLVESD